MRVPTLENDYIYISIVLSYNMSYNMNNNIM